MTVPQRSFPLAGAPPARPPAARMARGAAALVGLTMLGGCGSDLSAYERAVAGFEPVYCYQTLGDATCYRTPSFRDAGSLINFYGPPPRRYERPPPPPPARLDPPPLPEPRVTPLPAPPPPADPPIEAI